MLYNYSTEELIGLQGLIIKKSKQMKKKYISTVNSKGKHIYVLTVELKQTKYTTTVYK